MSSICKALVVTTALLWGYPAGVAAAGPDTLPLGPAYQPDPSAEVIYNILVAEMASKQEQPETALQHYRIAALASQDPAVAGRAAALALFLGNSPILLEMAQRWQTLAPNDLQARQMLALALLRTNHFDQAIPQLDTIRAAAIGDGQDGFGAIAALLDQLGDKELAFRALDQLRQRHPEAPFGQYQYALAALELKRHDQALNALQTALARNPQWAPGYLLRARVLMDKGDNEAALQSLANAVTALPANRELRTGYARLLIGAKRLEEAQRQFQILAEQNPKDADALFALGVLATEARQYDEAVARFTQALPLGTRTSDIYYELGRVEELRKNYGKAKEWYARVNDEDQYLNAQIHIGMILAKSGDFPAMSAHFTKLRQDNPQEAVSLLISEAEVLREEKRYQQGFDLLTQALAQYPDNPDVLYTRSLLAERLDRLDIVEQDLRRLIDANPKNGQALNALGYTLADRTDRYQEALQYLQQAIALLPNDPAVLDSMGWVYYRLGQYDKALDYLRRAYQLSEDDEIGAHLSEVLWVSGRRDEARKVWQKALDKEPDSDYLIKLKEMIEP
ncbi:MAG: tetratricopeptide repeat protein [Candidatus Competibacteraceae bacterium]